MQRLQNRYVFVRNITQRHSAASVYVSDVENLTVLKKKKKYKPPYSSEERGRERKKEREREIGGEEETRRNANGEREREEEKREKEAAIKQIWTCVRLAGRCGHCEYCGRKGTAWGETTLLLLLPPHRLRRCAAFARIPLTES